MLDAAPSSTPARAPLGDVELAKLLLISERELKAAKQTREALGDDVLERMVAGKLARLEVPGEGLVTVLQATTAHPVDGKACAVKVELLGARLRELRTLVWQHGAALEEPLRQLGAGGIALATFLRQLGEGDVDDVVPLGTTVRSASLRITPRL